MNGRDPQSLSDANPVLVIVERGPLVESRHRASVVVCTASGDEIFRRGDCAQLVLPRSSLKPFQALAMVESGAMDAFRLTPEYLALGCGSHNGELVHVQRVAEWLQAINCDESDLECAHDRPLGEKWLHLTPAECAPPSRLANNCSGKHAAFLTTALHLGVAKAGYTDPNHPVQERVAAILSELADWPVEDMPVASDYCGAPVFGMPLGALALAAARLGSMPRCNSVRKAAAERIIAAMRAHPTMVAGTGRADTILMQHPGFSGISKVGAEGVFMASVPSLGVGMAIKIDDGADRAAHVLGIAVLEEIGALDAEAAHDLHQRVAPKIIGTNGNPVAQIRIRPF